MQYEISIQVLASLCENGFSLDELVVRTKELFVQEGMGGFVGLLLRLIDEALCIQIVRGKRKVTGCCSCEDAAYEQSRQQARQFRTSIGEVALRWRVLRCVRCGKTVVPLREFLGIERYSSKSSELEKVVAEVMSEQSYRRGSSHLKTVGEIPVPKSTAHRWVMESDCADLKPIREVVASIFADGTGYKRRPAEEAGITNRGELRMALAVRDDGTVVPLGAWSGVAWQEIAQEIRQHTIKEGPLAKMLVSDGEEGIAHAFADLVEDSQRCHWHAVHDLDHTMWQDGAGKQERKAAQEHMTGIIGIELPEEDFERVSDEDKEHLESTTASAEKTVQQLVADLRQRGYETAARYVAQAKDKLFSYVRLWLKHGLVCPRASSMIERMMREVGRRLKKIGHGWKEAGAAKMARIIIKRFTSEHQWNSYWNEKLRLNDKVTLLLRGIAAS